MYSRPRKPSRSRLAICDLYSSTRGCSKADECNFLHICRAFIDGSCSYHCHFNHNFTSPQMSHILRMNALDPRSVQDTKFLLNLLKAKTKNGLESDEERDSDEEHAISNIDEATNNTPELPDENQQRELCIYYVKNGHCQNGKECPQLHVSRLPFKWQAGHYDSWWNLEQANNISVEASYCDPNVNSTKIKDGGIIYEVELTTMSLIPLSEKDDSQKIRRLSTISRIMNKNKRMDAVCTHWHWYYWNYCFERYKECRTGVLQNMCAINSDILEREYQTFLIGGPNPYGFTTHLNKEIRITVGNTTQLFLRRPTLGSSTSASSPLQAREICPIMLRNKKCDDEECHKFHSECPYQWQYVDFDSDYSWTNFPQDDNTGLEEIFCKPTTDALAYVLSDEDGYYYDKHLLKELTVSRFCTGNDIFRRISAMSTVQCHSPWLEPFCIDWLWYWQDVNGTWIQYAQKSAKDTTSDVDGDTLEGAYKDFLTGHGDKMFPFSTHENNYQLNFETMQQQNVHYRTQRSVRRRPKFQTESDRWQLVRQQETQDRSFEGIVPKTWIMKGMQMSSEPKLIRLHSKEEEYLTVEKMFLETMDDVNILAVKRVQNMELWDDYYRKREKMKRKSKHVLEKQLWHGTKRDSSEAICRQNFDLRFSGSNVGGLYGQGSYFHCKASYSNCYTALESNVRRMLLVRVLVGSYITGARGMKCPPPKDPYIPLGDLHDSCVDDDSNPSIFVIFEKSQVYPEYLVEYIKSSDGVASIASRAATSSVPKTTSRQASTRSINMHTTTPSRSLSRPGSISYSTNLHSANAPATPKSSSFHSPLIF